MDTLTRRIGGAAAAILLIGLSWALFQIFTSPPAGSYLVTAELGRAGAGLNTGTDVKVRGVAIGTVESIRYDQGTAYATLRLDPDPRLPTAQDIDLSIGAKTLLGEKVIELAFPDERFDDPPFLQEGDTIVAARQATELSTAVEEFEKFVDAIDGQALAAIIEAFAEQQGEAQRIVENLELGRRLTQFAERTADTNLANFRRFSDVADAISARADDFNRLNDLIPEATSLLPDRQAAVRTNLEALSRFSIGFAELLEVEEDEIDRLFDLQDVALAVLVENQNDIGNLVDGLYKYVRELGKGGIFLTDGTEAALFRIFLDPSGLQPLLCAELGGEFCEDETDDNPSSPENPENDPPSSGSGGVTLP